MRLRELQERSDLITVNRRLNPKIWDGDTLDPAVSDKLKEIAAAFEEFIGIDEVIEERQHEVFLHAIRRFVKD